MSTQRSITITDDMADTALAALVMAAHRFGATLPADPNERRAIAFATLCEGLRACPSPVPPDLAGAVEEWADPVVIALSRDDAEWLHAHLSNDLIGANGGPWVDGVLAALDDAAPMEAMS